MATYAMVTRLSPDALTRPNAVVSLNELVSDRLKAECPEVEWVASYALLGPYDYLDIFEAPSEECATKVSLIVRTLGHATTETWIATPWEQFAATAARLGGIVVEA